MYWMPKPFSSRLHSNLLVLTVLLATLLLPAAATAATLSVYIFPGTVVRQQLINEYVVPEFESRNPGTKVDVLAAEGAPDKLKTLVAGGLAPDIAFVRLEYFPDFVYTGLFEPLDAYFKSAQSFKLANIPEVAMDSFRYSGKTYGVPYDSLAFNVTTMFVNKDMFARAGLTVPQVNYDDPYSGWTYDDLAKYAKKMTIDKNGDGTPEEYGYLVGPYASFVGNAFRFIWNWGGDVITQTPAGWRSDVTNPQTQKALQFIHDLKFEQKVIGGDFLAGTRGMQIDAFGYISTILNKQVSFDWTLAAVPRGQGGRWGLTHVNPMGIMSSSKNKDLAFKFLEFWLSDEVQSRMADAGALPPQTYSVARRRTFMYTNTPPYDKSPFFFGRSRALPVWAPNWNEIQKVFTDSMNTVINKPEVPISNVIASLNDKIQTILK